MENDKDEMSDTGECGDAMADEASMPAVDDLTAAAIAAGLMPELCVVESKEGIVPVDTPATAGRAGQGEEGKVNNEADSSSDTSDMSDDDVPTPSGAAEVILPGASKRKHSEATHGSTRDTWKRFSAQMQAPCTWVPDLQDRQAGTRYHISKGAYIGWVLTQTPVHAHAHTLHTHTRRRRR